MSLAPKLVHGRVAPTPAQWREQHRSLPHTVFLLFAIALAALILAAVAAPEAHAQTDDDWGGAVWVSNVPNLPADSMLWGTSLRLNIKQGSSGSYYFRLSEAPEADDWYVRIFVEGMHIHDGVYPLPNGAGGVSWIPSIGYDFATNNYTRGRHVSVTVAADAVVGTEYEFEHEVWGSDGACPVHPDDPAHHDRVGRVIVKVIGNDEGTTTLPNLSIADATVEEGETAQFRVSLSTASTQTVTVRYQTHQGTADTAADFTGTQGQLSFPAGTTERFVEVQTTGDTTDEPDETFTVKLTDPDNATLLDDTAIGRINDDDPLPTLSIGDSTVEEGETARFEVTLTGTSTQTVTVAYTTVGGTAIQGTDYEAASGTLTFAAGSTTPQFIPVVTTEDTDDEPNEAFTVRLSSPSNATLADDSGAGTITDDDDSGNTLPTLSIGDATVEEGETARFEVTLTGTSTQTVTVAYATVGGTAIQGTDYEAASGTLTFAAGTTTPQFIPVVTTEDTADEPDEAFTVRLSSPSNATLADDSGAGTIEDDDEGDGNGDNGGDPSLPTLSIADAAAAVEGETARFTVTLSPASEETVTVGYQTHQGSAHTSLDFVGTSGTLTFTAGVTEQFIDVQTSEDTTDEPEESFTVALSEPINATLADDPEIGVGRIVDDDPLPTLSIDDVSVDEGDPASFTVTLSRASARDVTVAYATVGGTATQGTDYGGESGTLTFTAGNTEQNIQVQTTEDSDVEPDEGFTVVLSSPTNARISDNSGSGTIRNDDVGVDGALPTLSIDDVSVAEGDPASFTVTLTGTSTQTVTVDYLTVGGTATQGIDYEAASSTLTFDVGTTQQTIDVQTTEDSDVEPDEGFTVVLSNPTNATIADDSGSGTITNDDAIADGPDGDGPDGEGPDGDDTADRTPGTPMQQRIAQANKALLPEIGRAMAFTAVRCRIDQALSGIARGAGRPSASPSLSLMPVAGGHGAADGGSLSLEQALGGASFVLPLSRGEGGATEVATWGCGDFRALASDVAGDAGSWDGDVSTMQVGFDARFRSDMLAGMAISRSQGSFDYAGTSEDGGSGGGYDLQLTGIHPYWGMAVSPDVQIWGTVGLARGTLEAADRRAGASLDSGATLLSGTVGVNGRLLVQDETTLRLKGEWGFARLDLDSSDAAFRDAAASVSRLRLALEAEHWQLIPKVGLVTPWGEVGLRHDGGDGETGASAEIAGGVRYRNIEQGWSAEAYGRWRAARDALPEERGFATRFRYDPEVLGVGPWVSLTQSWGEAESRVYSIWDEDATTFAPHERPAQRLDVELAYGLPAFGGRGALTPFGALSLSDDDRRGYRVGSRLALGPSARVSLEAERREHAADDEDDHALLLRGDARF